MTSRSFQAGRNALVGSIIVLAILPCLPELILLGLEDSPGLFGGNTRGLMSLFGLIQGIHGGLGSLNLVLGVH